MTKLPARGNTITNSDGSTSPNPGAYRAGAVTTSASQSRAAQHAKNQEPLDAAAVMSTVTSRMLPASNEQAAKSAGEVFRSTGDGGGLYKRQAEQSVVEATQALFDSMDEVTAAETRLRISSKARDGGGSEDPAASFGQLSTEAEELASAAGHARTRYLETALVVARVSAAGTKGDEAWSAAEVSGRKAAQMLHRWKAYG